MQINCKISKRAIVAHIAKSLRGSVKLYKLSEPYRKLVDRSASQQKPSGKKRSWLPCGTSTAGEPEPLRGRSADRSEWRYSSPSESPSGCLACRTPRRGRSACRAAAERQRLRRLGGKALSMEVDEHKRHQMIASAADDSQGHGTQDGQDESIRTRGSSTPPMLSLADVPEPQEVPVPSPNLLFGSPARRACLSTEVCPPEHAAEVRHASAHAEVGSRAVGFQYLSIDTPSTQGSPGGSHSTLSVSPLLAVSTSTQSADGSARLQEAQDLLAQMLSKPRGGRRTSRRRHRRAESAPPVPIAPGILEMPEDEQRAGGQQAKTSPLQPINGAMPWFPSAEPSTAQDRELSRSIERKAFGTRSTDCQAAGLSGCAEQNAFGTVARDHEEQVAQWIPAGDDGNEQRQRVIGTMNHNDQSRQHLSEGVDSADRDFCVPLQVQLDESPLPTTCDVQPGDLDFCMLLRARLEEPPLLTPYEAPQADQDFCALLRARLDEPPLTNPDDSHGSLPCKEMALEEEMNVKRNCQLLMQQKTDHIGTDQSSVLSLTAASPECFEASVAVGFSLVTEKPKRRLRDFNEIMAERRSLNKD